jgi:hypothetical protein
MLLTNSHGEYLSRSGQTTQERSLAAQITPEWVSSCIVRFKMGEQYICCQEGPAFLADRYHDASLFLEKFGVYYTVKGRLLSLDRELIGQEVELGADLQLEYLNSSEQRYSEFLKEGYVTFPSEISPDQIQLARSCILEKSESRIGNLFQLSTVFGDILKCPQLKQFLDLIYSEYHLTTYSSNALRKQDPDGRKFHVDYPYHDLESPYPEELLGIQVIFTLDDFTYQNGATAYIPESFNWRCFPCNLENLEPSQVFYMTAPKGSWMVFRADLWHSQGINDTEIPRVGLLANFSPLKIPAKDPVSEQAREYLKIVDGKVFL